MTVKKAFRIPTGYGFGRSIKGREVNSDLVYFSKDILLLSPQRKESNAMNLPSSERQASLECYHLGRSWLVT